MKSFRTSDQRTLAYNVSGSGPMLVCHPGGPGFAHAELGELGGLSSTRTLVVLDPRGSGESDPAPDYLLDGYAADLDELRAHLGLERMDLLGYSHGGTVAIHYAARYPDGIDRLVLVGPAIKFSDQAKEFADKVIASKSGEPWYADAMASRDDEEGEPGAEWIRDAPLYCARWDDAYLPAIIAQTKGASVLPPLQDDQFLDVRDELELIGAPTLVVCGAQDFVCGQPSADELERRVPQARMAVLQDAGHLMYIEQPEAFRQAVASFLADA